jgi:WD40 repeat protein
MMKTIRVFVSSPGDVRTERTIAERLIRTTAEELGIPVSVQYSNLLPDQQFLQSSDSSIEPDSGELILCPYFWEYQRFSPELGYQDQIPNTAGFDLVICILWSRLGTKLHPSFQMPDGSEPRSGTDFEIAWAAAQRKKTPGVPQLHVYRNRSQPNPPLDSPERLEEFLTQWKSLNAFFDSWLKDDAGQFIGASNDYYNLEEFEQFFREHFRDFLSTQVSSERQRQLVGRPSQTRRWKENPFRGLQIFDFEHAPIFHGRTKAIGTVLEVLEIQIKAQRPFVLVVGASGSGKSSLVRAGVLPLLTQPETIEGIGLWRRAVTRPGAGGGDGDCFDALAAALLEPSAVPALRNSEALNSVRDLATELRDHCESAALRVRDALDHAAREWKIQQSHSLQERERQLRGSGRSQDADLVLQQRRRLELPKARLALVVDQLEELFTTASSPEVRQKYISAITGLVQSGRVFVLATLRSDFYPWYQQFPDLIELTRPAGKVDLRPPTAYEIGNMIRLPAEAAGLHFEQERGTAQRLDQALRDAASATPESLPLLEHVLSLLYDEQAVRGDDLLRWSDYRDLGELKGALARHAEAVFNTLQPHEQKAFPLVMRYLVTLGQGEEEVTNRRSAPYRDFVVSGGTDRDQKAGAQGFVDRLIEKRLLVADTDPQGEVTVSVVHEALLREWQRVKEWLKENREFLRMRDRLDSSLKLWSNRGKQKDDLLGPGLPLAEGEKLLSDHEPSLSREQIEYIRASIAERKRTKQVQERIRYGVMAAMAVLAIVAGFQWFRAERQRENAAQAFKSEAQVTVKLQQQLRQASWASFNQAERQFQLGGWQEGIALLARAIKFDPANQVASQRFFQELIIHREKALPRLIALFDHQVTVYGLAFSPDGARILTASWDKTAKLWDAASGQLIATFAHQGAVNTATFSPDCSQILTASADKTAKLWDVASGRVIGSFSHEGNVNAAVFSPNGTRILTASVDKTAKLWDAISGELIASFAHQGEVNDAMFSPHGDRILTTSADKSARLWDVASGKALASFYHQANVYHGAFSPDGAWILTASLDKTAKLWDAASGKLIASLEHQSGVRSAVFSPDGAWILTASMDKTAKLWDAPSGRLIASLDHQDGVVDAAFSPDGARVLTASLDKTAKLWDAPSGKLIASFPDPDELNAAAFAPAGARILTAGWDKTAKLWEAGSGEPVASFAHQDGLYHAVFSPDGVRILTGSADKTAKLWDGASGKLIASFAHQDGVIDAEFSPDGARILTASADKTAKLWDSATGQLIASFVHQDGVSVAVFSPDGTRILTASRDRTAKLWDPASDKLISSFTHQDEVNDAAFSPDGAQILTASTDKTAKLWSAVSGKLIVSFDHQDTVYRAAFSRDGARILTASADHSAKLWEAVSGKLIASFPHEDEVNDASFSPDGTRVLTASLDKTAKLWNASSGKLIASFAHQASVYQGVFSPDGNQILTASADNSAKLWDAVSGKLIASFDHQGTVRCLAFRPDGARVLTASWDKTARLWDAATPVVLARDVKESVDDVTRRDSSGSMTDSAISQVESLSIIASGLKFSDDGSLVAVDEQNRSELTRQLENSARAYRPSARFIRWFLSTGNERTIFPASDVRVVEWVENALLTNPNVNEEWVRNAMILLPDHPLLHIALAGIETDSKRAEFLRSFGFARLPKKTAVCTCAAEMLLAQQRPALALAAVNDALLADPNDVTARRLRVKVLGALPR